MRSKDSKGNWRDPFDPSAVGYGEGYDFTEGNSYQYTWHVMQNPDGLVAAMGGREAFVKRLDWLFERPEVVKGEVFDVTGLIGQYVHGNEPSHHVIYFYTLVGERDKAARRVRDVFDRFYLPKPDGLCGNDDCGQMSAWYVFSALGFYPFNPCGGTYVIGAADPEGDGEPGGQQDPDRRRQQPLRREQVREVGDVQRQAARQDDRARRPHVRRRTRL